MDFFSISCYIFSFQSHHLQRKRSSEADLTADCVFDSQDRVWASVAKCLNCVIAMVDKLQEEDSSKQETVPEQQLADVITSHNPGKRKEKKTLFVKHNHHIFVRNVHEKQLWILFCTFPLSWSYLMFAGQYPNLQPALDKNLRHLSTHSSLYSTQIDIHQFFTF